MRKIIFNFKGKQHYKSKLFISYLLLGMIILTTFFTASFSWFKHYIKNEISQLSYAQADNVNTTYQHIMDTYRQQLLNIYYNPFIKSYLYGNKGDFYRTYDVGRYLMSVLSYEGSIDYLLLFSGDNILMNSVYSGNPEKTETKDVLNQVLKTSNDKQYFIKKTAAGRKLFLFQTGRSYLNGKSDNGVIFCINLDKLLEKFIATSKNKSSTIIIYNKEKEKILAEKTDIHYEDSKLLASLDFSEEYSSRELTVDGIEYYCNYFINQETGDIIVLLQDFHSTIIDLVNAQRRMILLSFVVLIFTLIISYILTILFYKPFERFFNKLQNNFALVLPDQNSDNARKTEITMDKIVRQINLLSTHYQSNTIIRYLQGTADPERIPQELDLNNKHGLLILCYSEEAHNTDGLKHMAEVFQKKTETYLSKCNVFCFINTDEKRFLLLLKESNDTLLLKEKHKLLETLNKILEQIKTEDSIQLRISVSECIFEKEMFHSSYKKITKNIKYFLICGDLVIIEEDHDREALDTTIPKKLTCDIMSYIKEGSEQAAIDALPSLIGKLKSYRIQQVLLFLAEFTTDLNNLSEDFIINNKEYQERYLDNYLKLISCNNRPELLQWISGIILSTCMELRVVKEKSLRKNILESIDYIQNQYTDSNLSVESVAELYHISTSYFSKLFNEYTGSTFPEYISDLRLSNAKELLLKNPTATIKKISEASGFSSTSYFSALFKKKYGISPSEFRNKI